MKVARALQKNKLDIYDNPGTQQRNEGPGGFMTGTQVLKID